MGILLPLRAIAHRHLSELRSLARGMPVTVPSFGSQTVDVDDVLLAKDLLANPESWFDDRLVAEFERSFAEWNGSDHAFAFHSGREALSAAIHGLGLKPGDEVMIPGYTCVVVPNAFNYANLDIVYADIETDTYGVDIADVQRKVTTNTKAILLHHLYGLVARDYEAIIDLARNRGIPVIEDCAHSTGAEYRGKKVGTQGTVGFYSSEQSKVFTTIMGGVAVTDDPVVADRISDLQSRSPLPTEQHVRSLLTNVLLHYMQQKVHRRLWLSDLAEIRYGKYRIVSTPIEEQEGIRPSQYGQRMPGAIGALGINQMKKIERYSQLRQEQASRWDAWCESNGYRVPQVIEGSKPVYLRYPVQVSEGMKADRSWARRELGVDAGVWFAGTHHPVNRNAGLCPVADEAVRTVINLPTLGTHFGGERAGT